MARVANFELFSDVSFDLRIGADLDRTLNANINATDLPRYRGQLVKHSLSPGFLYYST